MVALIRTNGRWNNELIARFCMFVADGLKILAVALILALSLC